MSKTLAQVAWRGDSCPNPGNKVRVAGALSNLVELKMSLLTAGGLD